MGATVLVFCRSGREARAVPEFEKIRASVASDLVLRDLPPKPLELIRYTLSYPNAKYVRAKRMGFPTEGEPERIACAIEAPDGSMHVPRGSIGVVRELLAECRFGLEVVEDRRSSGSKIGPFPSVSLRDYQEEGVLELIRKLQGIAVLPCGGGKTRLGVGAVGALSVTTLVIVPTKDLADQWIAELQNLLSVEAGLVGDGKDTGDRDIVVAIDDSLVLKLGREPEWAQKFGLIIFDEIHHCPSKTAQSILLRIPARYRLGLTATLMREDGATPLIGWSFGPILVERTTKQLLDLGILMPAEIEYVETGWTFSYPILEPVRRHLESKDGFKRRHSKWTRERLVVMEAELVEDLMRNVDIADRAADDAKAGETVLILTGRRDHTKELAEMICARGVEAVALTSASGRKKRREAIQNLKDGKLPVMIATSLADEGLDVTRLSRVILAFPQRAKAATLQRLGRLLRNFPGKRPKLVDLVDSKVPTLRKRADARKKTYRETGLLQSWE